MLGKTKRAYFLALLLGAVFFAAQLHCCVDIHSRTMDSHACPICSTAGTAIATPSLVLEMAPVTNWLEAFAVIAVVPVVFSCNVTPRAPPSF